MSFIDNIVARITKHADIGESMTTGNPPTGRPVTGLSDMPQVRPGSEDATAMQPIDDPDDAQRRMEVGQQSGSPFRLGTTAHAKLADVQGTPGSQLPPFVPGQSALPGLPGAIAPATPSPATSGTAVASAPMPADAKAAAAPVGMPPPGALPVPGQAAPTMPAPEITTSNQPQKPLAVVPPKVQTGGTTASGAAIKHATTSALARASSIRSPRRWHPWQIGLDLSRSNNRLIDRLFKPADLLIRL